MCQFIEQQEWLIHTENSRRITRSKNRVDACLFSPKLSAKTFNAIVLVGLDSQGQWSLYAPISPVSPNSATTLRLAFRFVRLMIFKLPGKPRKWEMKPNTVHILLQLPSSPPCPPFLPDGCRKRDPPPPGNTIHYSHARTRTKKGKPREARGDKLVRSATSLLVRSFKENILNVSLTVRKCASSRLYSLFSPKVVPFRRCTCSSSRQVTANSRDRNSL